jgi:acetyl/propionyl-CoA carboxylase alpha subunit
MRRALSETFIVGIDTTIPFYSYVLAQPEYASGKLDTTMIADFVSRMGADVTSGSEPVLANASQSLRPEHA